MTEDEARLKRCCGPDGCGQVNAADTLRYCIASACMAWVSGDEVPRYEYSEGGVQPDGYGWQLHEQNLATSYFLWRRPVRSEHTDGRCGLVVKS